MSVNYFPGAVRVKFSNKLSFAILTTGVSVLILLSFAIYKFSHDAIIQSGFMSTQASVDEVSADVDQLLSEKMNTTVTLANAPIIKKALEASNLSNGKLSDEKRTESIRFLNEKWKSTKDPDDEFIQKITGAHVSRFLKKQQDLFKGEYGEIFLTDKFGALVGSTSKLSTFAHGHKYWWLGAYNHGEGAVFFDDRGYDDSVGGYVLGLAVPIGDGAEIIGVLKCNFNILGSLGDLISGAKNKSNGNFKLIRSRGMIVFEKGSEPLSTRVEDAVIGQLQDENNQPFIINDAGVKRLVASSEITLTKGEKGYGFGGAFESIDHKKGNTGESWIVLCYREMRVITAPIVETITSILLIGGAIILILVTVSYLLSRKIAKPLSALDKAAETIGKGKLAYRIDMRRDDEFGNLARSFNSMASKLQQRSRKLRRQSGELKKKNLELDDQRKQLEEINRMKDEFLANMSHELRTPLNSVMALSRVLIKGAGEKLTEEEREYPRS